MAARRAGAGRRADARRRRPVQPGARRGGARAPHLRRPRPASSTRSSGAPPSCCSPTSRSADADPRPLARALEQQAPWSDLPILLLCGRGADARLAAWALDTLGNVTVLERPIRVTTLVSALRVAVRARHRQYELRESDRRKDEFLATLSHELRNPLAPLRNGLHMLRRDASASPSARDLYELMERQVDHLVRLVDDLLELSRVTRGTLSLRMERVSLAEVVRARWKRASRPSPRRAIGWSSRSRRARCGSTGTACASRRSSPTCSTTRRSTPTRAARIDVEARRGGRQREGVRARQRHGHLARVAAAGVRDVQPRRSRAAPRRGGARHRARHRATARGDAQGKPGGAQRGRRTRQRVRRPPPDGAGRGAGRGARPRGRGRRFPPGASSWSTTTGTPPTACGWCSRRSAPRCASPTTVTRRSRPSPTSAPRSCSWTSGCRAWTATRWRGACVPRSREPHAALIALTGWGQEEDRQAAAEAGFDHHLVKPAEIGALRALLASLGGRASEPAVPRSRAGALNVARRRRVAACLQCSGPFDSAITTAGAGEA